MHIIFQFKTSYLNFLEFFFSSVHVLPRRHVSSIRSRMSANYFHRPLLICPAKSFQSFQVFISSSTVHQPPSLQIHPRPGRPFFFDFLAELPYLPSYPFHCSRIPSSPYLSLVSSWTVPRTFRVTRLHIINSIPRHFFPLHRRPLHPNTNIMSLCPVTNPRRLTPVHHRRSTSGRIYPENPLILRGHVTSSLTTDVEIPPRTTTPFRFNFFLRQKKKIDQTDYSILGTFHSTFNLFICFFSYRKHGRTVEKTSL